MAKKDISGGATKGPGSKSVGPSRATTAMGKSLTATQGPGMGTKVAKYGNSHSEGKTALSRGKIGSGAALSKGDSLGAAMDGAKHNGGRAAMQPSKSRKDLGGSTVGGKGW